MNRKTFHTTAILLVGTICLTAFFLRSWNSATNKKIPTAIARIMLNPKADSKFVEEVLGSPTHSFSAEQYNRKVAADVASSYGPPPPKTSNGEVQEFNWLPNLILVLYDRSGKVESVYWGRT